MEKERYKMREPKEIFTPLPLLKNPKSGLMKQQLPKKGGGRRKHTFKKHFSKKCRKTRRTKCRKHTFKKGVTKHTFKKGVTKRKTKHYARA
jgi:hypothetical protein